MQLTTCRRLAVSTLAVAATFAVVPALTANATAPADNPIEPIDSALVAIAVTMDEAQPLCDAYATVVLAVDGLGVDAATEQIFVAMADAYLIDLFQDSMGESARLTAEAEAILVDFLHGCGGVAG